jgi:hypothetical protein
VDDTSTWEFAAVVAAVCIGLGGLLLFTAIGAIGAWRVYDAARRASGEAARAAASVEVLARALAEQAESMPAALLGESAPRIAEAADELTRLRAQAADLLLQQTRLNDAVRNLVEAGVLRGDESNQQLREFEHTLRRVEQHLARITAPGAR